MDRYSEAFFESYRLAVEAAYEIYLESVGTGFLGTNTNMDDKLAICMQNEYAKWLDTSQDKLLGKAPSEYLNTIEDLNSMMVMFRHGAFICDEGLPDIFLQKLRSYNENAVDALIEVAVECNAWSNDDSLFIPVMAVKVLGMWRAEKAAEPLIRMLYTDGGVPDLMYETVKETLVFIGISALDPIANALESGEDPNTADEYLLMALSQIGKVHNNDRIYRLLKSAFLRMPGKLVPSSCLGDYGDGRAIPVLRGYIQKNGHMLDKQTFYEIISSIQKLGGNTGDLTFRG